MALGFLSTLSADGFVLHAKLWCDRTGRTNASFSSEMHRKLSNYTPKQLLCILGTFILGH